MSAAFYEDRESCHGGCTLLSYIKREKKLLSSQNKCYINLAITIEKYYGFNRNCYFYLLNNIYLLLSLDNF